MPEEEPAVEPLRWSESPQNEPGLRPILVQIKGAAALLDVSVRQVYALAAKHADFPRPRYIDSRPRWLWEDLRAFARAAPTRPLKTRAQRPPGGGA